MDEDKTKVEETNAAMDSAPIGVEVAAPPVEEADMETGVESAGPVAPEVPTAGTIEAIVMAEPTPAVEDAPVPVMELETPITIAVVEPGLTPAVSVPDVLAADSSARTADDEAMLVNDEWAMDGVWPSGVAISYHYSEFDIVVDTSADMAAAERDRIAWVKQCRASEIEADEEEIPGLVLPPPTSSPAFRCASFEWKTLDLGLPGSSLYSPPSPGSDSDSSDSGPPTPKDVYDPEEIALYGRFNDGLTK